MKKRALLIGINNYLHYEKQSLNGCINDTKIMTAVLEEKFGFGKDDITILNDEEATRDAIVKELNRLLDNCKFNDIVVFHFSGHGTRRRSKEAGKPDGMEETIMPYDTGSEPELVRDIRDSDLQNWLALLTEKTSNIVLIVDSCHSGSSFRGEKVRSIITDLRDTSTLSESISLEPSPDSDLFPESSANWLSLADNYSLLTACEKTELAWEYATIENGNKKHYGAFTWFLAQELENSPPAYTYQDVFEQLRIKMQTGNLLQNPQIEGNKTQQLFSGVKSEVMRYVSVKNRKENEVTLSAGAVHGLTANSKWAIYPPATRDASPEKKIGDVIINNVDSVTSKGEIVEEKNIHQIKAGCRAVEEVHYYKDQKKVVFINSLTNEPAQFMKIINDDVKNSSLLALTDSTTESDYVVSLSENRGSGEFQLKILQSGDRKVLSKISILNDNDLLKIRRNLETLSRYSIVSDLKNPSSKLNGLIEFTLLQNIDGKWQDAPPAYNDLPIYLEDEQIAFRVINKSRIPLHISILDLGLTRKISLLYPNNSASERIGSNSVATTQNPDMGILKVGVEPNENIMLYIPENAFLTNFSNINQRGGIEIFKLLATTEQTDFSWIEQDGMIARNNLQNTDSSLEELLYKYLSEDQTREIYKEANEPNDWFTIERAFYLCKN